MQNWVGSIWGGFFFPGIQTEVHGYADRNTYVNTLDPDLDGYEIQNHAVGLFQVEDEQAKREEEGYAVPISRDKIFRQLNAPTQALVEMLAKGMKRSEIAVNLKLSPSQLRRRLDKAVDESNLLEWPEENSFSIQACADEPVFELLLGVPEAAKLLCVHPKTLQALARSGSVPCVRFRKYWRFRASVLDAWVRERLISDHQSRRVS